MGQQKSWTGTKGPCGHTVVTIKASLEPTCEEAQQAPYIWVPLWGRALVIVSVHSLWAREADPESPHMEGVDEGMDSTPACYDLEGFSFLVQAQPPQPPHTQSHQVPKSTANVPFPHFSFLV